MNRALMLGRDPMSSSFAALLTVFLHVSIAIAQYLIRNDSALVPAVLLYYVAVAALVVCYVSVLDSVIETPCRRAWLTIVGVPVLVHIGWLAWNPALSMDAYSYLVDAAHMYAGVNPYEHAVKE